MLTFHPQGIHHGPQADAVTRTKNVERTNEIAIMIDTKKPLNVNENAQKFENVEYWKSWMK
jgi:homogentisate 1,2-dioxygenase